MRSRDHQDRERPKKTPTNGRRRRRRQRSSESKEKFHGRGPMLFHLLPAVRKGKKRVEWIFFYKVMESNDSSNQTKKPFSFMGERKKEVSGRQQSRDETGERISALALTKGGRRNLKLLPPSLPFLNWLFFLPPTRSAQLLFREDEKN